MTNNNPDQNNERKTTCNKSAHNKGTAECGCTEDCGCGLNCQCKDYTKEPEKNASHVKLHISFAFRIVLIVFLCLLLSSLISILTILIAKRSGLNIHSANITGTITIAFSLSCILGTIFAAVLSKHISAEHEKFKRAVTEVANGNFDVMFPDSPDKIYGSIGIELNKMVKDLKSTSVLRNDFVSNFSHELKTPITSINGFAELLMGDVTDAERKEYAQIIYDESARLLTLAKNTLLLSKLESQGVCNKHTFQLNELTENCLMLLSKEFEKKDIGLSCDLQKVSYYWDDSLLGQAIINLISNAVKYTPSGGNVRVELNKQDDFIYLTVKDDGCGMDEKTLERIFERYYQGDSSHKTEGNGLGLAIVSKIAYLCGGKIKAESILGHGSTFTLILPEKKDTLTPSLK